MSRCAHDRVARVGEVTAVMVQQPGGPVTVGVIGTPSAVLTFRDPAGLRQYAATLLDAADEWARVTGGARYGHHLAARVG